VAMSTRVEVAGRAMVLQGLGRVGRRDCASLWGLRLERQRCVAIRRCCCLPDILRRWIPAG
jgi:hypothetical protein